MIALSVKPKWAELIASRRKTLEIRSRRTRHRGPLLICSTRPEGIARCIVNVVGCRPFAPQDAQAACVPWAPGLWAWELAEAQPTPPLRVRGQQGMFHVDLEARTRSPQTRSPRPVAPAR
jgi:hypothetical protein